MLCLVMIVKDAGEEIIPVLRSIKPYLSSYCISDTGSIDNTPDVIREELAGLPGAVYEDGWFDFGTNRNIAISHAEQDWPSDFYLMLDDSYVLTSGNPLDVIRQLNPKLSANYLVHVVDKERSYFSGRLFTRGQRYRYRIHEVFEKPAEGAVDLTFEDVVSPNHNQRSKKRYAYDLHLLAQDEKDFPDDPRPVYYTARTYHMLENNGKAAEYFRRRVDMAMDASNLYEVYNSYFYLAIIAYKKFVITRQQPDCDAAIDRFRLCHRLFPHRAEPLYHLATILTYFYYNTHADEILQLLESAIQIPIPDDNDVYYEVYTTKLPYRLAYHYYRNGKNKEAVTAILKHRTPENHLRYDNLLIAMGALKRQSVEHHPEETIVIYATDVVSLPWNGEKMNHQCSGSEYMAARLGEYFASKGKRVYIFCVCDGLEGEVNGVMYRPVKEYYPFLLKTWIDVLVVSRDTSKLSYLPHIKNVFLWIHDLEPIGEEFQTSVNFRAAIVLTESHKKHIIRSFQMNEKLLEIIPNSIQTYPDYLSIEKKPMQFIYSSSPDRGLDKLLAVFQQIVKKYKQATLVIYANESLISADAKRLLSETANVVCRPRASREELHKAYAESDYWLYPTEFVETYCITAAEAQYYKCVCVCSAIGALVDTVGARGVMLKRVLEKDWESEVLQKIEFLESNKNMKEIYRQRGHDWAREQTIENIGVRWQKLIRA
jgi:glycosyltransferase involved in cell wall biosynthesis